MLKRGLDRLAQELRGEADKIERELASLNHGEKELAALDREQGVAAESFQTYAKRLAEARISEALDLRRVSNVALLSAPVVSPEPVYPRKLLIVLISLPFGLTLGIALALLLEYLNDTIRDRRDLRGFPELPVLGRLRI